MCGLVHEELEVVLREALHSGVGDFRGGPAHRPMHDLPEGHGPRHEGQLGTGLDDVPEDLNFMEGLVFVLIHIAPQAHLHFCPLNTF